MELQAKCLDCHPENLAVKVSVHKCEPHECAAFSEVLSKLWKLEHELERQIVKVYDDKLKISQRNVKSQAEFLQKCDDMNACDAKVAKLRAQIANLWE